MSGTGKLAYRSPGTLLGREPRGVLLALSGGADSRALLDLLEKNERQRDPAFRLVLAHVNHGIRGEEAERDERFCEALAREYDLPIRVFREDVPRLAQTSGRGIEETAREVRYAFFEKVMREEGIEVLATAHHADDNLETMIFRMARGSGGRGMRGIPPVRPFADGFLIRPLLTCTGEEIRAYCRENDLNFVTDSTNADVSYARNRIRAEIVPILGVIFQNPQRAALRLSGNLREDGEYLEAEAEKLLERAKKSADPAFPGLASERLSRSTLGNAHPAIRKRAVAAWVSEMSGRCPESCHLELTESMILTGEPRAVAFPGDGNLILCPGSDSLRWEAPEKADGTPYQLPFSEGTTAIPDTDLEISVKKQSGQQKINKLATTSEMEFSLPSAIIEKEPLTWRNRRAGDRIRRGGMHRKIRKLWGEKKIPGRLREFLPILCRGDEILWVPGIGASDTLEEEIGNERKESGQPDELWTVTVGIRKKENLPNQRKD